LSGVLAAWNGYLIFALQLLWSSWVARSSWRGACWRCCRWPRFASSTVPGP